MNTGDLHHFFNKSHGAIRKAKMASGLAITCLSAALMSACGGGDGNPGPYAPLGGPVSLYVSTSKGQIAGIDSSLTKLEQVVNTGLTGTIAASQGWLYQAGLASSGGELIGIYSVSERGATVNYDQFQDFNVAVDTMVQPAGVTVGRYGYEQIIGDAQTADPEGPAMHLMNRYANLKSDTLKPAEYLVLTQTQVGAPTWASAYDVPTDRLFVSRTDGVVLVFDNFYLTSIAGTPVATRTITPGTLTAGVGSKISTNLHGIAYDNANDVLYVADVGDTASATDGAIYVFAKASTVSDSGTGTAVTVPDGIIAGSSTHLGNPDSLALSNNVLAVADSGSGYFMAFDNPSAASNGDFAPNVMFTPASFGLSGMPVSVAFPQ